MVPVIWAVFGVRFANASVVAVGATAVVVVVVVLVVGASVVVVVVLVANPEQSVTAPTKPVGPTNTAHLVEPPNCNKYNPAPSSGVHVICKVESKYNWAPSVGTLPKAGGWYITAVIVPPQANNSVPYFVVKETPNWIPAAVVLVVVVLVVVGAAVVVVLVVLVVGAAVVVVVVVLVPEKQIVSEVSSPATTPETYHQLVPSE